ncbi:MAG: hypothetical protein LBG42_08990, partial [Treponema sp.]|nr:hypothetical protein [Treponema sp.]
MENSYIKKFRGIYTFEKRKGRIKMEQTFVEKMEKSLTDLKMEIISNLLVSNADFKEIVEGMDPKDLAD